LAELLYEIRQLQESQVARLLELHGHQRAILAIALDAKGARVASGSYDTTIRIWDAMTGVGISKLVGHTGGVHSVAFSPDNNQLASGSADTTIKVWDANSAACSATLLGHTEGVTAVAFSTDSKRLASGSEDGTVQIWKVAAQSKLVTLRGHTDRVTSITFASSGNRLATYSEDTTVRVWDTMLGVCTATFDNEWDICPSVTSPNGLYVVVRDANHQVRLLGDEDDLLSPVSTPGMFSGTVFFDHSTGWLLFKQLPTSVPKQIYWIPVERRPSDEWRVLRNHGHRVVFGSESGIVTILDVSLS
jgi:WD40 repeat protein